MGNEHMSSANNETTFIDNDQPNMSQSLDELITESCNRMGIVDQTDPNAHESTYASTENGHINPNQSMLQFECDSFNLNDLAFCTGETTNTDLADVMPSMDEIFPNIEIMNVLYDNMNVSNGDMQQFYSAAPQ